MIDATDGPGDRLDPLPADPAAVALYLSDRAGRLAVATLQRHLTSISQAHQHAGHDSPTGAKPVREIWRGIRRTFGVASQGKAPLLTDDIRAMAARLDRDRLIDVRDRALLLIGYAGALRRSDLLEGVSQGVQVGVGPLVASQPQQVVARVCTAHSAQEDSRLFLIEASLDSISSPMGVGEE